MTATEREQRAGRCPDGGYCHGETFVAGSAPCPEDGCFRVRNAGPLSGVYPGDNWPAEVIAAHNRCPHCGREPITAFGETHGFVVTVHRDLGHPDRVDRTVCIDADGYELEPEEKDSRG